MNIFWDYTQVNLNRKKLWAPSSIHFAEFVTPGTCPILEKLIGLGVPI